MIERFALIKPQVDAHTLGLHSFAELLKDCGYEVIFAPSEMSKALEQVRYQSQRRSIVEWLQKEEIVRLGLSYRLDPRQGKDMVGYLLDELLNSKMLVHQGGPLRGFYFAGLPEACLSVEKEYQGLVKTFQGGETIQETLFKLGVPDERMPSGLLAGSKYDEERLNFGRELISSQAYRQVKPFSRGKCYGEFGTKQDTLEKRYNSLGANPERPLFRAHAGPYSTVHEFEAWALELAQAGFLDILSIGTSQLTQSHFGENWEGLANGGGVPINSEQDYEGIWEKSRPLLVRTYAGTRNIPELAVLHEKTLNICWHALSFWWFNQLDGRGPNSLLENLGQHVKTTEWIAKTGKPLEANVSHHFAFRGADDVTYLVAAYLAAKLAKQKGIRTFVLQNMLNTPRQTWGLQDLAKSRALLALVRTLEDANFKVFLQPRAGLDYFRPELEEAKAQLAAVTALMDDIDPHNQKSPSLIHVVSFSEGSHLATPEIINESIQITSAALEHYRNLRKKELVDDSSTNQFVEERAVNLRNDAREVIRTIEKHIPNAYSAEGFYTIFMSGFLPTPFLWAEGAEFEHVRRFTTKLVQGGVQVVDDEGKTLKLETRLDYALNQLRQVEYNIKNITKNE